MRAGPQPCSEMLSLRVVTSTQRSLPLPPNLGARRALKQMAQPGLLFQLRGPAHSPSSGLVCPPLGYDAHYPIFVSGICLVAFTTRDPAYPHISGSSRSVQYPFHASLSAPRSHFQGPERYAGRRLEDLATSPCLRDGQEQ